MPIQQHSGALGHIGLVGLEVPAGEGGDAILAKSQRPGRVGQLPGDARTPLGNVRFERADGLVELKPLLLVQSASATGDYPATMVTPALTR